MFITSSTLSSSVSVRLCEVTISIRNDLIDFNTHIKCISFSIPAMTSERSRVSLSRCNKGGLFFALLLYDKRNNHV